MIWVDILVVVLMVCFGGVLLFGAPYLPTMKPQVKAAFDLADLKPGDSLIELGSGDGRVLLAAAQQGATAIGYELNPLLVVYSRFVTRKYRRQVRIIWGNFWQKEWPEADTIFTFLLPKYMKKLDKKIAQYPHKPVKMVSHAFEIPGRRPDASKKGVFLYRF